MPNGGQEKNPSNGSASSIRARIVSHVRGFDLVVPFEAKDDMTVSQALRRIRHQGRRPLNE